MRQPGELRGSSFQTAVALVALGFFLAAVAWPAKKKKEEETQTLQLPKELPGAVVGETRRLAFYVTPLSAKGLLSQQIRDALKSLERQSGGSPLLHIRAFVAGSGDLRRVRDLVSETFTERRQALPALSLVQAGGLPLVGAQVVLEGVGAARKELYPGGLAFLSAQMAASDNPQDPVAPLAEKSMAALRQAVSAAGATPADVVRVTCFLSSLGDIAAIRQRVQAEYARAALNYVQTQRAPEAAVAACEAVAGLQQSPTGPLEMRSPEGLRRQGESQIALVGSPRLVLSGTQVSFGYEEPDARLALERLRKLLEPFGVSPADVACARFYPLSRKIEQQVLALRRSFFNPARPPAGSLLLMEGLSSQDAGFALDVVAAKK